MQDQVFSRNTVNYVFFPVLTIKHCNTWRKCRAEENCNIIPKSATVLVAVQKCSEAKEMTLILLTEEWMGFLWKAEKKGAFNFFPQSLVFRPYSLPRPCSVTQTYILRDILLQVTIIFVYTCKYFLGFWTVQQKIRFNWHGHA